MKNLVYTLLILFIFFQFDAPNLVSDKALNYGKKN